MLQQSKRAGTPARRAWKTWVQAGATLAAVFATIALASVRASHIGVAYRPARDSEIVLERSTVRPEQAVRTRQLRAQLRAAPRDLAAALRLARAEIESSRVSGDLRPLGRAEAALSLFTQAAPDARVLVLRATILQARHDFAAALADLDAALRLDASDPQAHLTRASVLSVLGRYDEARQSCAALASLTAPYVTSLCRASVDGYTDQRAGALVALQTALHAARTPPERAWVLSVLCELSLWGDELEAARAACSAALQLDPADRYTRALYADVLLEQKQPAQVLAQVSADSQDDALLLRRALAELALRRPEAARSVAALQARFAQSRTRGDRVHQREEARLLLALGNAPERALALAREGFAAQHEPWDARLLLQAAHAAHAAQAAAPVATFLREEHVNAKLIVRELARLGSAS